MWSKVTLGPSREAWALIRHKPWQLLLATLVTSAPLIAISRSWGSEPPTLLRAIVVGALGAASSFGYLAIIAWLLFGTTLSFTKSFQGTCVGYSLGLALWWALSRQAHSVSSWQPLSLWIQVIGALSVVWSFWRPLVLFGGEAPVPAIGRALREFAANWLTLLVNLWAFPSLLIIMVTAALTLAGADLAAKIPFMLLAAVAVVPFQETVLLVLCRQSFGAPSSPALGTEATAT